MSFIIPHGPRSGFITVPSSKSQLHRLLILAALGEKPVTIQKKGQAADVSAAAACLNALGAAVTEETDCFHVTPIPREREAVHHNIPLPCGESAAVLRFLLPLTGLLEIPAVFMREGRLPQRPLEPFLNALRAHGMQFREEGSLLYAEGKLTGGAYTLPGDISSQFISALLLTLPMLKEDSALRVMAPVESAAYLEMTEQALESAGIMTEKASLSRKEEKNLQWDSLYWITGSRIPSLPQQLAAEGDFSAAAVFMAMGALSPRGIALTGLSPTSRQADMLILDILQRMGADIGATPEVIAVRKPSEPLKAITFNASQAPDLAPVAAVLAACCEGESKLTGLERLRHKESDRLDGILSLLTSLGVKASLNEESVLSIQGGCVRGGAVDVRHDHRLAMAAAIAACAAEEPVVINDAECVAKSYSAFWDDFGALTLEAADESVVSPHNKNEQSEML